MPGDHGSEDFAAAIAAKIALAANDEEAAVVAASSSETTTLSRSEPSGVPVTEPEELPIQQVPSRDESFKSTSSKLTDKDSFRERRRMRKQKMNSPASSSRDAKSFASSTGARVGAYSSTRLALSSMEGKDISKLKYGTPSQTPSQQDPSTSTDVEEQNISGDLPALRRGVPIREEATFGSQPGAYSMSLNDRDDSRDGDHRGATSPTDLVYMSTRYPSSDASAIVAELVESQQFKKERDMTTMISSVAVKESCCTLLRHNRRTQIMVACIVLAVIGLVVGLGASFSLRKNSTAPPPQERQRLEAYATIDGTDHRGEFGSSLSFSADATRIAIGSPGAADGAGSVEVYERQVDGSWKVIGGRLVGNTTADKLGTGLALSRDGQTLATCSPGGLGTIAVYSLSFTRGEWVQLGEPITGIECNSVSLSRDGDLCAIAGLDSISGEHIVSIFEILGDEWTLIGSFSGHTAALSANGRIVAIGTESNMAMGDPAKLSVHEFASIGNWRKLGSDVYGDIGLYDHGWLTVTSDDGNTVAIGGYYVDPETKLDPTHPNATISALSAKVYRFGGTDGDDGWSQVGQTLHQYVEGSHGVYPVSLSANGEVLAIGDPGKLVARGGNSGHAHVARLEPNVETGKEEWVHIAADVDGEAAGDQFGKALVVSADGGMVAVGAPFNRGNGFEHGRVQVFDFADVESEGSF